MESLFGKKVFEAAKPTLDDYKTIQMCIRDRVQSRKGCLSFEFLPNRNECGRFVHLYGFEDRTNYIPTDKNKESESRQSGNLCEDRA